MVVRGEFVQALAQVPLAERDDPVQAFLFHRADKPLSVRIAIRRAGRRPDDTHSGRCQPLLDAPAPLRIAIAQQNPFVVQKALLTSGLSQTLNDERLVRLRRAPDHLDAPRLYIEQERHVIGHQTRRVHASVVKKSAYQLQPIAA